MHLLLTRDFDDGVCTLGDLKVGELHLATIERPWLPEPNGKVGGVQGRSCVPRGFYALIPHDSEAHPRTFALENAALGVTHWGPSQRTAVLIHPANRAEELRGCIAPGLVRGSHAVLHSRAAFEQLQAVLPWVPGHMLEIRGP